MHMWGQMIPERGLSEYPTKIFTKALVLLASEDDSAHFVLEFPYVGIDWRQFPNILFIVTNPLNDRGHISVFLKLT